MKNVDNAELTWFNNYSYGWAIWQSFIISDSQLELVLAYSQLCSCGHGTIGISNGYRTWTTAVY